MFSGAYYAAPRQAAGGADVSANAPVREAALDGVRGLAIAMVLLWHCLYLIPASPLAVAWNRIAGIGWLGVDLFFVLSGYLITRILIHERGRGDYYSRFYLRRVFRIFPAYYAMLLLIWALLPHVPPPDWDGAVLQQWPLFVAHLQNWGMALNHTAYDWPGIHHFWSLAIEEQFYLLWPLLVAATSDRVLRRVCVLLIAGSIALKALLVAAHTSWSVIYMVTPGRLEGLAGGALIATLTPALAQHWRRWIVVAGWAGLAGLGLQLVSGAMMTSRLTLVWAIPSATAAFVWLLFSLQQQTVPDRLLRVLRNPVLIWLGLYSYGLYLCHYPIYWMLRTRLMQSDPAAVPDNVDVLLTGTLAIVLSLAFARLLHACIEAPALRLRDRLQRRRPSTQGTL